MNYLPDLSELVVSKLREHRIHDVYKISVFGFTFGFEQSFCLFLPAYPFSNPRLPAKMPGAPAGI